MRRPLVGLPEGHFWESGREDTQMSFTHSLSKLEQAKARRMRAKGKKSFNTSASPPPSLTQLRYHHSLAISILHLNLVESH